MNTPRLTRRGILLGAAAVVAARICPTRAQTAVDEGCTVSFVNGLVQLNPECQLTPAGLGMAVSPPSQLVSLTQVAASTTKGASGSATPQSGGRRQRAAQRHRLQKQRRLANQRRQRKRHGGGRGGTTTPTV
jgi:hypothetical protein